MSLTARSCCSDSRKKDITRLPALSSRRLLMIGAAGLLWRSGGSRRWSTSIGCSPTRRGADRVPRASLVAVVSARAAANIDGAYGEPCLCSITRLELLYSARSARAYEELEIELDAFQQLSVDAETSATALTTQRELATHSQHRVPIPDLLIAACAQQHQAAVLHVDRHYETLARVLAFTPIRLSS